MILVSAIITTHNRFECLKKAIESVLSQTYPNIELIVVNDNSTDETDDYCHSCDSLRYVYISQSESRGGNYARNVGASIARGKYLAFLDDDDMWLPTKIEKQLEEAERTGAGLVYCRRVFEWDDPQRPSIVERIEECPDGDLSQRIFCHYVSSTSCFFIEASLFREIEGFDLNVRVWQDYDLFIALAQKTSVTLVNDVLVRYRLDDTDKLKISNKFKNVPQSMWYLQKKYWGIIRKLPLSVSFAFYSLIINEVYFRAVRFNNKGFKYLLKPMVWMLSKVERYEAKLY